MVMSAPVVDRVHRVGRALVARRAAARARPALAAALLVGAGAARVVGAHRGTLFNDHMVDSECEKCTRKSTTARVGRWKLDDTCEKYWLWYWHSKPPGQHF
jgi:hypothetical protein